MSPLRVLTACVLALGLVAGGVAFRSSRVHGSQPREWGITATERLALVGLDGRMQMLDQEVARIASGDPVLARAIVSVAFALREIDKATVELVHDARASRDISQDVALVRSGSSWAEVRR